MPEGHASPLGAHAASPAELRDRIETERKGRPFLVLREEAGPQRIVELEPATDRLSIGRSPQNAIDLQWDTEVSRLHAELEQIGGEWTVSDDGLSRNGTYVNGARISGRHRLRDGDVLRVGKTLIAYRRPGDAGLAARRRSPACSCSCRTCRRCSARFCSRSRVPSSTGSSRRRRPTRRSPTSCTCRSTPSSPTCGRSFGRFGIEHLPQNQKRSRLVAEALQAGLIGIRDL